MTKTIQQGNKAVVIHSNGEGCVFSARLYVNARDGIINASATNIARTFQTLKGAEKFAAKTLA